MERLVVWHRWIVPAREIEGEAETIDAFMRSSAARLRAAGATIVAQMSGTVVATLDPGELSEAVDLALEVLEAADTAGPDGAPIAVAFALAAGHVYPPDPETSAPLRGSALDRAQQIANRARGGELVLDASARELAAYEYLFSRNVGGGSGAPRGQSLDRRHPRREECRIALSKMGDPPIAPCALDAQKELERVARLGEKARVALRGPFGAGASTLAAAVEKTIAPSFVLHVGTVPGGLEPLGSLRLALGRHGAGFDAIRSRMREAYGDSVVEEFDAIASGHGITRPQAVSAVAALIDAHAEPGANCPWIIIDPALGADPATIEIIDEAQRAAMTPSLVIARLPVDAAMPHPLAEPLPVHEITIAVLHTSDALTIARAVLREGTDEDIVRRVAVLGGESPLGVVEAARVLVASGELVPTDTGFGWRNAPRNVSGAAPVDAIVLERIRVLDRVAQQTLEVACVIPDGSPAALVEAVAAYDGLSSAKCARALDALVADGLVRTGGRPTPTGKVLRGAVLRAMPSARATELHRAVADALAVAGDVRQQGFAAATLAYYLAEGGLATEAAEALLSAARAASAGGFVRSALRLASNAVRLDPSETMRNAAAAVTHTASTRPPPPATPLPEQRLPPPPASPSGDESLSFEERLRLASEAIRAHDFETAERILDSVDPDEEATGGAAARLRAVARLGSGDPIAAMEGLARARATGDQDPRETARMSLALGVALLRSGDASAGIRAALGALATSRTTGDERGERAALLTLAACYRHLGRHDEAVRLQIAGGG